MSLKNIQVGDLLFVYTKEYYFEDANEDYTKYFVIALTTNNNFISCLTPNGICSFDEWLLNECSNRN